MECGPLLAEAPFVQLAIQRELGLRVLAAHELHGLSVRLRAAIRCRAAEQSALAELTLQIACEPFKTREGLDIGAEDFTNGICDKGVVCAPQNDAIKWMLPHWSEEFGQVVLNFRKCGRPFFDEFGEAGAGKRIDVRVVAEAPHLIMEFLQAQREWRGHDEDILLARIHRQLERGFDAEEGDVGVALHQFRLGGAGGGVAGDDDRFHRVIAQMIDGCTGEFVHLIRAFLAIGSIGGIPVEDEILVGQHAGQCSERADAAHTGIEYTNRIMLIDHFNLSL